MMTRWFYFIRRYAISLIALISFLACLLPYYIATHLQVNTNTEAMISDDLSWRQDYIALKKLFPHVHQNILIILQAPTPEQALQASEPLLEKLNQTDIIESAFAFEHDPFFQKHRLLYLKDDALKNLSQRLPPLRPLLNLNPHDLNQYLGVLQNAVKNPIQYETFQPIFAQLEKALEANRASIFAPLSYTSLFNQPPKSYQLIEVKPKLNFQSLKPAQEAIQTIQSIYNDLNLQDRFDTQLKLTGDVVFMEEELEAAKVGASWAALIAFTLVFVLLTLSLRSFKLVCAALLTLILGLIYTTAFATAFIGHLNLISVAFAALYIGLSIDFSIHMILRFKENRAQYEKPTKALKQTVNQLAPSLTLCALSTCIGFYAFLPSNFEGVSELGLIAGTGMLISLVLNFSFLPALLSRFSIKADKPNLPYAQIPLHPSKPDLKIILGFFGALFIGSISLLGFLDFDADPMRLRDPNAPSMQAYSWLKTQSENSITPISIVLEDHEKFETLKSALKKELPTVQLIDISSFIPENQSEKLQLIKKLRNSLNAQATQPVSESLESRLKGLAELRDQLWRTEKEDAQNFANAIETYLAFLSRQSDHKQKSHLDLLSQSLLSHLNYQTKIIQRALSPKRIKQEHLPEHFKARWKNNHTSRLELLLPKTLATSEKNEIMKTVKNIAPHATGLPIIHDHASETIIDAFIQAFLMALFGIIVLMIVIRIPVRNIILILVPLLGACLLTAGACALMGLSLNFANIIALPLLLGLGVDNGIHLVHRFTNKPKDTSIFATSTVKAILVSTLTTIFSFISLAFTTHLGLQSLSILLTLGMLMILICTLLLLPALMALWPPKAKKRIG